MFRFVAPMICVYFFFQLALSASICCSTIQLVGYIFNTMHDTHLINKVFQVSVKRFVLKIMIRQKMLKLSCIYFCIFGSYFFNYLAHPQFLLFFSLIFLTLFNFIKYVPENFFCSFLFLSMFEFALQTLSNFTQSTFIIFIGVKGKKKCYEEKSKVSLCYLSIDLLFAPYC